MPEPVVCPSCARVFPTTLDTCPGCGWQTALSANHRRTRVMSEPGSTRFAKIELEKQAVRTDTPLELPPEDDEPVGGLTRQERAFPASTTPPRLDADALPTGPHLVPGEPRTAPEASAVPARPRPAEPPAVRTEPSTPATPSPQGALELPPDASELPTLPETRPVARASSPRPASASVELSLGPSFAPFLTEPLERWALGALVVMVPMGVLVAVDALFASRPEVPAATGWLVVACLAGGSVALTRVSRLSLVLGGLAGVVLALGSLRAETVTVALSVAWAVSVCVSQVLSRLQGLTLGLGLTAILALAPAMLDGALTTPLVGTPRARLAGRSGPPARGPWIDQQTGLQLTATTPALVVRSAGATTRLEDPALGLEVAQASLPPGLDLASATLTARDWLESLGLEHVTLAEARTTQGRFDASTTQAFTAQLGRAALRGQLRVGILGADTFAIATWARAHREAKLREAFGAILEGAVYQPPARPRLADERRSQLTHALVTNSSREVTGVRVTAAGKVLLLLPASATGTMQLSSDQGSFPVDLGSSVVASGVRLLVLGGGAALPLRRLAGAPRQTRVILAAEGVIGGWLTDEPGSPTRRAELLQGRPGPVVDLEGNVVGFAVREGSELVVTTVDALDAALGRITGGPVQLAPATSEAPAPLFTPANAEGEVAGPSADVSGSVLIVRTPAGLAGAAVIGATERAWALVVEAAIIPPGATTVSVRLPQAEVRPADVVKVAHRVALLRLPRDDGDGLQVLPLVEANPGASARRETWGFREDPTTGAPALKRAAGLLSAEGFELEPGPVLSSGPVLSADGRAAAYRFGSGQAIVAAPLLQELSAPAVRDVFWRIAGEASGTCQLAATIELDDPFGEATLVRLRVLADQPTLPTRLTAPAMTDATPKGGKASMLNRFRCFTAPQLFQFEVQGPSGARASRIQRVPPLSVLPGIVRGRAGPSEGASRAPAALLTELWEIPAPLTLVHPCRTAPEQCERACYVDEVDACTLDGRFALATKDVGRAIARLDARCADDDLEACTLLLWALAEKRSARAPTSKPDAMLAPFCRGGLKRACAALGPAEWKKELAARTATCGRAKRDCDELGRHLLLGPRLDVDITRALKAFRDACGAGNDRACADSALESLRYGREEPLAVLERAARACEAGFVDACLLGAMNAALGITVPRTPQAAEKQLEESCARGSVEACLMSL
ncbi:MAG: hypothetical protein JNJ54_33990 [Myxococcaceae bacterium]|nr:hypothetical protein [Myxococcaceae bacterium]